MSMRYELPIKVYTTGFSTRGIHDDMYSWTVGATEISDEWLTRLPRGDHHFWDPHLLRPLFLHLLLIGVRVGLRDGNLKRDALH